MADKPEPAYDKHDNSPAEHDKRIRDRAHKMWKAEGSPEGREDQYWNRAKKTIDAESQTAYPPTQSRGNRN